MAKLTSIKFLVFGLVFCFVGTLLLKAVLPVDGRLGEPEGKVAQGSSEVTNIITAEDEELVESKSDPESARRLSSKDGEENGEEIRVETKPTARNLAASQGVDVADVFVSTTYHSTGKSITGSLADNILGDLYFSGIRTMVGGSWKALMKFWLNITKYGNIRPVFKEEFKKFLLSVFDGDELEVTSKGYRSVQNSFVERCINIWDTAPVPLKRDTSSIVQAVIDNDDFKQLVVRSYAAYLPGIKESYDRVRRERRSMSKQ